MSKKLLSLYGLKWNPFAPDVPTEALWLRPRVESFGWRIENLAREGGFALIAGEPGVGKSVALRLLVERLAGLRDLKVGLLSRPQSGVADFYREMGDLFGVPLAPHNRWAGAKALREKWQVHIDAALFRPVLIVDEAQEMPPLVLNELRLLWSLRLDSHILLTTVLAGDRRLLEKLRSEELLALGSRMRVKLLIERATPAELEELLRHALSQAGAPKLMTRELLTTLCEHAAGNPRALMTMAGELLAVGAEREVSQLDEKLYLEIFAVPPPAEAKAAASARRRTAYWYQSRGRSGRRNGERRVRVRFNRRGSATGKSPGSRRRSARRARVSDERFRRTSALGGPLPGIRVEDQLSDR